MHGAQWPTSRAAPDGTPDPSRKPPPPPQSRPSSLPSRAARPHARRPHSRPDPSRKPPPAAAATLPASPRLPAELLRLVVHGRDSGITFADFPYNLRLPSIDKLIMHQDTNCVWSATFCLQVHHLLAIRSIASLISNHLELSAAVHVL
ncbi:unnamed protein product [Urochloa humidicola]